MTAQRFCFVTTFYPPFNFGGDGIGVQRLAQALARRGHEVTVVHDADAYDVLAPGVDLESQPDPFGVNVITLRSRFPLLSTLLTHQAGAPVTNRRRLGQILAPGRFDVINFNNISLIGGPGLLAYGEGAIKLYLAHEHWLVCPTHVLWRHGRERCDERQCLRCQLRYRRPPQWWRYTGLLERQLSHVDAFLAMSEFSRRKHREFGFPHEMEVLPYFLPDNVSPTSHRHPPPSDRPYFLFVGRLEAIKGLQDVIPAFAAADGPELLIAGDGSYGEELRRLAAGCPRLRFMGRVSPERLDALYQHALALIVPSLCYETFGIILIEAFRQGAPVIARRLGPFPEIVETSHGGVLFDDLRELQDALRLFEEDAERRLAMGRAGRAAFLTHWSESAVVPRYLDLVRRLQATRGGARLRDADAAAQDGAGAVPQRQAACERS